MTAHAIPLQVRLAPATDLGRFKGVANHFPTTDAHGTRFARGAFRRSLAEHQTRGTRVAMLWAHDVRQPIGEWLRIEESGDGLQVEGQLVLEVQQAREALALMKRGLVALSVGFIPRQQRRAADGVTEFTDVDLGEVSLVALPSNHNSTITEVRQAPTPRDLEQALRDAGLSNRQAKALLAGGYHAMRRDGADDATDASLTAGLRDILQSIRGTTHGS